MVLNKRGFLAHLNPRGIEDETEHNHQKASAEKVVKDIRRVTRRQFGAEEKIRIVLEGLRGEDSIAELCRREGINQNLYYRWSKDFLEPGRSAWRVTLPVRLPPMRSGIFAVRHWHSRRPLLT